MPNLAALFRNEKRNIKLIVAAGAYSLIGGIICLGGWILDIPRLASWYGNGATIQPNATLCVILCSLALFALIFGKSRAASIFGTAVLMIGGCTLFEWVSGYSLGIDSMLMFERTWGREGVVFPGRMGPPGSLSWTLLGLAMIFSASSNRLRPPPPCPG